MSKDVVHFEDLAAGMRFKAGPTVLTEEAIIAFAKEYDPQSFHTDPEAAEASFFKGHAASGWQTAAVTMRMLVESSSLFASGSVGMSVELSWPRPVRPGDALSVEVEIIEIRPSSKPGRAVTALKTTTTNQNGEIVQVMTSKNILFSNRSGAPGA